MSDSRTWITAIVALIVGGAIGYFVTQGQVSDLQARLSAAETELVQANEVAGTMAADAEELGAENQTLTEEVTSLRAELEERDALIEQQQATIDELEAAQQEPATEEPQ